MLSASNNDEVKENRSLENISKTKQYMKDYFKRTIQRKFTHQLEKEPEYLKRFKYKKDPDINGKFKAIIQGEYDLEQEEKDLSQLSKVINSKP